MKISEALRLLVRFIAILNIKHSGFNRFIFINVPIKIIIFRGHLSFLK